jgi:signal transduction histidine kinase/CheY-like chemotaxis protein
LGFLIFIPSTKIKLLATSLEINLLTKNPLFMGLDNHEVDKVLHAAKINNCKPGDILLEKGAPPQNLMLLCQGTIDVFNEDVLLARVESPAVLGESILAGSVASATLVAGTNVLLCAISKNNFLELSRDNPKLILNLFKLNHERLKQSNEKALQESKKREQILEEQVVIRTHELNDALSELKVSNNELTVTRDRLIETEKFRQQFLANMSHEIRTPMNAVVGLTNLLLKSDLDLQQIKYLNVISKSGENLLVIINDILDLAKIEAGKMELEKISFNFHVSLQNIQTILNLKAEEKGIKLNLIIGDGVPEYIVGDETRLTQIIMNLAGNAIKFTEKGAVAIEVSLVQGKQYRISVKDSGIGIPADKLGKIFESFSQASSDTTRKFGGTGLGLSISRQLVELHGGKLDVQSTFGEGSDFFFEMELEQGESPVDEAAEVVLDPGKIAALKILLVDDNEFNQMVAVDTLEYLFPGIAVDVADSGFIALDKLAETDYNFVFMDIQMPGMDGYETTRKIRTTLAGKMKDVNICAMTANVTKEEIQQCYDSGMDDYMMKPFTPDQLKNKVIRNGLMDNDS